MYYDSRNVPRRKDTKCQFKEKIDPVPYKLCLKAELNSNFATKKYNSLASVQLSNFYHVPTKEATFYNNLIKYLLLFEKFCDPNLFFIHTRTKKEYLI